MHSVKPDFATFAKAYERLNAEQRQAVDTIEGPLMVLAGPGTGKTEVVGVRVGHILKKTHARPSNILCLTFSTSGATAMRERLRRLIGPDAYGVTVTTIHGFCNDIILNHPDLFAERRLEEQATDVRRFRLLNTLIDQLPASSVMLNPKDPYARTSEILTRISQCKREGVSPARAAEVAEIYTVEMSQKSKPGTKVQARNERMAKQAQEFARLYAAYEAALHEEGLFDYDDMIAVATEALKSEDWLLAGLQERYQYIMVDEYQDTNGAQNAFIAALTATPEAAGEPNLCVVGDDDQAIYRFQGANVAGMLQFRARFPECPIAVLQTSYRSTQPILDAASRLIAINDDRLVGKVPGIAKNLKSGLKDSSGDEPLLLRAVSDAVEPFVVAELIEAELAAGTPASEIAVITRTNGELFEFYDVLRGLKIPAQITGKLNLLHSAAVLQLIAMLRAVNDLRDDHALATALHIICFDCHSADLARLWTLQRELNGEREHAKLRLIDVLADVERLTTEKGVELHALPSLLRARDFLLKLRGHLETVTLPETIEKLIRESGILPKDPLQADPMAVVALTEFFDHVKRRNYEDPTFTLTELLTDLEYRQGYGLKLQYDIPHLIDDGVQLLTAHGSKGLEFQVVIVVGFREKHWDHRRPSPGLALPEELLFGAPLAEGLQDERRLAYVAWTRAKRSLILSCPERVIRGEREQDVSPSAFAVEGGPLPEQTIELKDTTRSSLLLLPKAALDDALKSYLRSKLETFELSVTALNHFLEDPEIFLRQDLLGLPQAKSPTLAYGTAVHEGLRAWARLARESGESSEAALLEGFARGITEREILTEKERERLLHLGRQALPRYFAARLQGGAPVIWGIEQKVSARLGDIRLKGLMDRIDLYHVDGAKVKVIDYKTGRPKTEKEVREGDNGNLYRQLAFYKLLIEHSPQMLGYEPVEFFLEFVGEREEEPSSLAFTIPETDARELQALIEQVWAKILALDFTPLDVDKNKSMSH